MKSSLNAWPQVLNESDTLDLLLGGMSIGRLGDGELKVAYGQGYSGQTPNRDLAAEMREFLRRPAPGCLAGIPTMDPTGPKIDYWRRHEDRFLALLDSRVPYASAFIGREDHAPIVGTLAFIARFARLWQGRRATVVCHPDSKATRVDQLAKRMEWVECPMVNAYDVIDSIERACVVARADITLISCGVTATVLANRLASRGIHAIDLGSGGRLIGRKEERRVEPVQEDVL